jgi:hypothetical protein
MRFILSLSDTYRLLLEKNLVDGQIRHERQLSHALMSLKLSFSFESTAYYIGTAKIERDTSITQNSHLKLPRLTYRTILYFN